MSYCVNCGVELEAGAKKCPLCDTEIINPREHVCSQTSPYPVYTPTPKQQIKRSTIVSLITLILLLPDFLTVLSDYSINRSITWSGYVLMSILCVYLLIVLPIILKKHMSVCISLMSLSVLVFLIYIEYKTGGKWFLSFALPAVTAIAVFIVVMVLLRKENKITPLTVVSLSMIFTGAYCVLLEFLINATFGICETFAWSFYPAVTFLILAIAIFFIQKNKPLVEKLEKKFFL